MVKPPITNRTAVQRDVVTAAAAQARALSPSSIIAHIQRTVETTPLFHHAVLPSRPFRITKLISTVAGICCYMRRQRHARRAAVIPHRQAANVMFSRLQTSLSELLHTTSQPAATSASSQPRQQPPPPKKRQRFAPCYVTFRVFRQPRSELIAPSSRHGHAVCYGARTRCFVTE